MSALEETDGQQLKVSLDEVLQELNRLREDPPTYSLGLENLKTHFSNEDDPLVLTLPDSSFQIRTKEGIEAVDEAIRELRLTPPLPPLRLDENMSKASEEVIADIGHNGELGQIAKMKRLRMGKGCANRLQRYGLWKKCCSENISYGRLTPRGIISQLLVDDGVSSRGHRRNLLNAAFKVVGIAASAHSLCKFMCVIDLAGYFCAAVPGATSKTDRKKRSIARTSQPSIANLDESFRRLSSTPGSGDSERKKKHQTSTPEMVDPESIQTFFREVGAYGFLTMAQIQAFVKKNSMSFNDEKLDAIVKGTVKYRLGEVYSGSKIEVLPEDVVLAVGFRTIKDMENQTQTYVLKPHRAQWISMLRVFHHCNDRAVFSAKSILRRRSSVRLRNHSRSSSIHDWVSAGDVRVSQLNSNLKTRHSHRMSICESIADSMDSTRAVDASATARDSIKKRRPSIFDKEFNALEDTVVGPENDVAAFQKEIVAHENMIDALNASVFKEPPSLHPQEGPFSRHRPLIPTKGRMTFEAYAQFRSFLYRYESQREGQRNSKRTKDDVIDALALQGERAEAGENSISNTIQSLSPNGTVADDILRDAMLRKQYRGLHENPFQIFFKIKEAEPNLHSESAPSANQYSFRTDYNPVRDGKPPFVLSLPKGKKPGSSTNEVLAGIDNRPIETTTQQAEEEQRLISECAERVAAEIRNLEKGAGLDSHRKQLNHEPIEILSHELLRRHFLTSLPPLEANNLAEISKARKKASRSLGVTLPEKRSYMASIRNKVTRKVNQLLGLHIGEPHLTQAKSFKSVFQKLGKQQQMDGELFPVSGRAPMAANGTNNQAADQDDRDIQLQHMRLHFRPLCPSDRVGLGSDRNAASKTERQQVAQVAR